jgi:hypothetical protein
MMAAKSRDSVLAEEEVNKEVAVTAAWFTCTAAGRESAMGE